MSAIDLKLKSYDELIFEITTLTTNNYLLQQKVKQLEKENEYLKMSNPEQNMEHFRIVNENKRKIDMLRKENHQLENIRKEIKEYIEKNVACFKNGDMLVELNVDDLLNILNKGDNNVKDKR